MFTSISSCCIDKYRSNFHLAAIGIDLLAGVTALALGIIHLTVPQSGLGFSSAVQWALIGGGAVYTLPMLLIIAVIIKDSSRFKHTFIIK